MSGFTYLCILSPSAWPIISSITPCWKKKGKLAQNSYTQCRISTHHDITKIRKIVLPVVGGVVVAVVVDVVVVVVVDVVVPVVVVVEVDVVVVVVVEVDVVVVVVVVGAAEIIIKI